MYKSNFSLTFSSFMEGLSLQAPSRIIYSCSTGGYPFIYPNTIGAEKIKMYGKIYFGSLINIDFNIPKLEASLLKVTRNIFLIYPQVRISSWNFT